MLEIDRVGKRFQGPDGPIAALDGVSLTASPGEVVAVRGRSGSGKTTLLLVAGGLLEPDAGAVRLAGEDVWSLPRGSRARLRASRIGFVFQQFHLIPYLSALDNILAPALAVDVPEAAGRARELAERLGLGERLRHVPAELSVGERQRVAMARALLVAPRVILADEPTGNLDRESAENLLGHLAEFARGGGAVLLVTHDPLAEGYATRSLAIEKGRLIAEGPGDGDAP